MGIEETRINCRYPPKEKQGSTLTAPSSFLFHGLACLTIKSNTMEAQETLGLGLSL